MKPDHQCPDCLASLNGFREWPQSPRRSFFRAQCDRCGWTGPKTMSSSSIEYSIPERCPFCNLKASGPTELREHIAAEHLPILAEDARRPNPETQAVAYRYKLQQETYWQHGEGLPSDDFVDFCRRSTRKLELLYHSPVESVPPQQSAEPVGELMFRDGIVSFHTLMPIEQLHPGKVFYVAASPGPSELVEEMEVAVKELEDVEFSGWQPYREDAKEDKAVYWRDVQECIDKLRALITRHRGKSCAHDRKHAQFQSSAPMVLIESPDYAEYLRTHPSQVPSQETQAAKLRELEKEFRETAETLAGTASAAGVLACADRLSAVIRGTKT